VGNLDAQGNAIRMSRVWRACRSIAASSLLTLSQALFEGSLSRATKSGLRRLITTSKFSDTLEHHLIQAPSTIQSIDVLDEVHHLNT
jgi:hypothetical protein